MLSTLLATLGISIFVKANIFADCGFKPAEIPQGRYLAGCQRERTVYILKDNNLKQQEFYTYHEIAHTISRSTSTRNVIKDYQPLFKYSSLYKNKDQLLDEMWADYYASYKTDKSFSLFHPSLFIYFRDYETKILSTR